MGPEVSEKMMQNLFLDVLRFNSIRHATLLHHLLREKRGGRRERRGERERERERGKEGGVQRRKRKVVRFND